MHRATSSTFNDSQTFLCEPDEKLWSVPAKGARSVRFGARIKLKNALNKHYTQLQIDPPNLAGLLGLIATISFQHADPSTI